MKIIFFAITVLMLNICPALAGGGHDHAHDFGEAGHDKPEKGPHGGRLLKKEDFAVEITIFEKGVPPQFRVFAYGDGTPLKTEEFTTSITLVRFGGKEEKFDLSPAGEFLTSSKTVEEPHSFEVLATASYRGATYEWRYDSFEGRTEISQEALKAANLEFDVAGKREIANRINVYGRLIPSEDRTAHITARFPGIILDVKKKLGDSVKKGDVLAVIESNQNLRPYEILSFIDGTVVERHASLGEFAPENQELFVVADLSEVWANFQVYKDDFEVVEPGQTINIELNEEADEIKGQISYISPLIDEATQSRLVRAVLPNPRMKLKPGLFLSGTISLSQKEVPLAVKLDAIQTFRDWNVVYLTDGHVFQAMPVELGRRDGYYVEILSGIDPGARYVSGNSFLIRADIEKSGASHDH